MVLNINLFHYKREEKNICPDHFSWTVLGSLIKTSQKGSLIKGLPFSPNFINQDKEVD